MNTVDLRQFVDVVVDGEKLDEDRYEVEMTSAPIATDTVSARRSQSLRVTVNETALSRDTCRYRNHMGKQYRIWGGSPTQ